jgi:hypothetical protein
MNDGRLSHFEGPVEEKKTGHISRNNYYLDREEGWISYEPEPWARPTKKREIGTALSPVFRAISVQSFLSGKPLREGCMGNGK